MKKPQEKWMCIRQRTKQWKVPKYFRWKTGKNKCPKTCTIPRMDKLQQFVRVCIMCFLVVGNRTKCRVRGWASTGPHHMSKVISTERQTPRTSKLLAYYHQTVLWEIPFKLRPTDMQYVSSLCNIRFNQPRACSRMLLENFQVNSIHTFYVKPTGK